MRRGLALAAVTTLAVLVSGCSGAGAGDQQEAEAPTQSAEPAAAGSFDLSGYSSEIQEALAEYDVAGLGEPVLLESRFGEHEITLDGPRRMDPPQKMVDDYDLLENGEWYFSIDATVAALQDGTVSEPLTLDDFFDFSVLHEEDVLDGPGGTAGNNSTWFFEDLAGPDLRSELTTGDTLEGTLTFGLSDEREGLYLLTSRGLDGVSDFAIAFDAEDIGPADPADTAAAGPGDLPAVESADEVTTDQENIVSFGEDVTVSTRYGDYTYTIEQPRRIEIPEDAYPVDAEDSWFPLAFEVTIEASNVPDHQNQRYRSMRGWLALQEPQDEDRLGLEGNGTRVGFSLAKSLPDDVSVNTVLEEGAPVTGDLVMLVEEREVYELRNDDYFSVLFLHEEILPAEG